MPQTGNIPKGVPHPTRSLGYQIIRWAQKYIVQPDGEDAGQPWKFTPEQLRFVLWMYAIDENGRWLYRTAALRRAKGWGKTPLLAALCIVEFVGPARFSHFDENGMPVGKRVPLPLVQIAATSLDQTANTRDMIRGMLAESPAEAEYNIEIGKGLIQFKDGRPGRIEPVTSSSRGLEGARPSFVVCDEVHHWIESNQGVYVWETLDRNVQKTAGAGSRLIETTNAYNPNENSIAQRTHEAVVGGAGRLLYDCVEAEKDVDLKDREAVIAAIIDAYGDSHWVDVEGIADAIQDPRTPAAVAYRFYLNNIQENADGWMSKDEWELCFQDDDPIRPGDQVAIGFDGSIRGDATGLVGCRLRDGKLFLLHLQENPRNPNQPDWEVDVLAVEAAVANAFRMYQVEWFYGDPPYWQEAIGRWSIEHGDDYVFEYWTNKPTRMAQATERFRTAAMVQDLKHDGNEDISRHVLNAVTREVPQGTLIIKDSPRSKKKIDLAVCSILAFEARADAIADGRLKKRRSRVVGF
ncbi:terminase [Streptomyces scabiei]|uniref:terminase n=1 Tax=Streptomyces scabiei TaxID=1930 RepID=UPI0029AA3403|nr:terminase [Streptomyces scabiei]MDX3206057.1 terminase large subunit [Streptomyces scabiei]